jgi:hypothetical protein
VAKKARNLAVAVTRAAAGAIIGKPIMADEATVNARRAECFVCEFNAPTGNLGFGECRHPGCGCTKAKLLLASALCPARRWRS